MNKFTGIRKKTNALGSIQTSIAFKLQKTIDLARI